MDIIAPAEVAKIAANALEMRRSLPPSRRGGTMVGVARARQLANKQPLSKRTLQRMISYFSRHAVDKNAEGFREGEAGFPSKGRQAWDLWGGDPAWKWAKKTLQSMEQERTEMIDVHVLTGADIRRIDGKFGKISKVSMPWVTVEWAGGKRESFLRSDEALHEDIQLKTLDKGWLSLGSILGAPSKFEAHTDALGEALETVKALRSGMRLTESAEIDTHSALKARLLAQLESKGEEVTEAVKASDAAKAKLAAMKKKLAAKKAEKKAAKGKKAPAKKAAAKKPAKKPVKKKKLAGKGGKPNDPNPYSPFRNYKTIGGKNSPKKVRRTQKKIWKCKAGEGGQVCTALKDVPEQGIKKGVKKVIAPWAGKAAYMADYVAGRASGKYKPDGEKIAIPVVHKWY